MAVVGCERADLALHYHTEVPMPLPADFIQTIFSTPLGELLQAVGVAFSGGQGGPSLPPPMAAGNLSDAIGAALIDDGHSDLVTQGTTPDGSIYNEIGPDLTDAAADVLWALGWPVAEYLQPILSSALGQPDLLVSDAAGIPAELAEAYKIVKKQDRYAAVGAVKKKAETTTMKVVKTMDMRS